MLAVGPCALEAVEGLFQEPRRVSMGLHSKADEMAGTQMVPDCPKDPAREFRFDTALACRAAAGGVEDDVPEQRVGVIFCQVSGCWTLLPIPPTFAHVHPPFDARSGIGCSVTSRPALRAKRPFMVDQIRAFAHLADVPPRDAWPHEARDFTP